MNHSQITEFLHKSIPITGPMGVEVVRADSEQVALCAPFAANKNHKETAFGGSINAVMTLSCWTWLDLYLGKKGIEAKCVIQKSSTDYRAPILGDFVATCHAPTSEALEKFEKILKKKGIARISLSAKVTKNNETQAEFKGHFVAHQ